MLGNEAVDAEQIRPAPSSESTRALACALAGAPADRFLNEMLSHGLGGSRGAWDATEIIARLDDPALCLATIYARYAFSRRGKDRKALADLATEALEATLGGGETFADISGSELWNRYCEGCLAASPKVAPDQNKGVVLGMATLVQTVARDKGVSLARHAANAATQHGRVEPLFFGIVELRGVGPKVAATMLRDWIYAYGAEASVVHRDSIYLQPIDRWTRAAAPHLLEDAGSDAFPDWILAGKLAKAARNAGVSGIRLNMGITLLGLEAAPGPAPDARFAEMLRSLL
ncbi:MAG: hypothetical protein ACYC96_02665 [Fimbriimonadaceae bacterium]